MKAFSTPPPLSLLLFIFRHYPFICFEMSLPQFPPPSPPSCPRFFPSLPSPLSGPPLPPDACKLTFLFAGSPLGYVKSIYDSTKELVPLTDLSFFFFLFSSFLLLTPTRTLRIMETPFLLFDFLLILFPPCPLLPLQKICRRREDIPLQDPPTPFFLMIPFFSFPPQSSGFQNPLRRSFFESSRARSWSFLFFVLRGDFLVNYYSGATGLVFPLPLISSRLAFLTVQIQA